MRQRYRLLKDTALIKAGAIIEENCDDGTQDFAYRDTEHLQNQECGYRNYSNAMFTFPRRVVENSPEWFEKVTLVELSISEIAKLGKILKGK